MTNSFTPAARAIFAKRAIAHVASVGLDGAPYVSPVWVELEGDDIVINTALGRAKARNMANDPRVAVSLTDPDNPYVAIAVLGTVVAFTTQGGDEGIDRLARKYLGVERFERSREGEVRVRVLIRPDRVVMQPD
jgi:PPOX class probable F420-dependent enzyme